jgi:outer membrane protein OmpU
MNGFTIALGSGQTFDPINMASEGGLGFTDGRDNFWAIGAKYATDAFSVALGYQTADAGDIVSASGSYTAAGFTGMVKIADDSRVSETLWALSGSYAMDGGIGLVAYYNHDQNGTDVLTGESDGTAGAAYGFGASYDLGGGASVVGGIAQRDNDGYGSIFDLGVQMSF